MERPKSSLSLLLEAFENDESPSSRLHIAKEVRDRLSLPTSLFGDIPFAFHDITFVLCLVSTLKDKSRECLSASKKHQMCRHLGTVCLHLMKPTPQLSQNLILDLLHVFRNFFMSRFTSFPEETESFFRALYEETEKGTCDQKVLKELWLVSRWSFERTILECFLPAANESHWNFVVSSCLNSPKLFRAAASIVNGICRMSKGSDFVIRTARRFFVPIAEMRDNLEKVLKLLPEHLHPIVILLSLPCKHLPPDIILIHLEHFCDVALNGLYEGTWSLDDIRMLALILPDWYNVLLEAIEAEKASLLAKTLLSVLWEFNCSNKYQHMLIALREKSWVNI